MELLFHTTDSDQTKKNLSKHQVIDLLVKQKIQSDTILYSTKESCAKPMCHHSDFQYLFCLKNTDSYWVLLKKNQDQFIQTEGYCTSGLQSLLREGYVCDQDFVWKKGFTSWKRISICTEFHTKPEATLEDLMDEMKLKNQYPSSSELEQNVEVYKRNPIAFCTWSKWIK